MHNKICSTGGTRFHPRRRGRKAPVLSSVQLEGRRSHSCSEVLSGEATLRICSSKQQQDRRDHSANSLITLAKGPLDICFRRHFSFRWGRRELNGPKQQQKKKERENQTSREKKANADGREAKNSPERMTGIDLKGFKVCLIRSSDRKSSPEGKQERDEAAGKCRRRRGTAAVNQHAASLEF